jgi:hypothetical protein
MPANGRKRKRLFVRGLEEVLTEQAAAGEPFDPDRATDALAARIGGVRLRPEHDDVPLPFAKPSGFVTPHVPPGPLTARRRATLLDQINAKRPELRRAAVSLLGAKLDDPRISDAIRTASVEDADPYVRGLALMCLGVQTNDSAESLVAGAERLIEEAPLVKPHTRASDLAWEAAAYGILGAAAAAVRARRFEMAGVLRRLTDLLDPSPSFDGSDAPGRRRSALMSIVHDLEGGINEGAGWQAGELTSVVKIDT